VPPGPTAGVRERAPLSFAQQRLWFLHQLDPADPAYHVTLALELTGPLAAMALRHAVVAIGGRHDALRMVFGAAAGRPFQRPTRAVGSPAHVDLAGLPVERAEAVQDRLLRASAARAFDLTAAPPVRWAVLRMGAGRHVLVLGVHHIVFDGGSLAVVAAELGEGYRAAVAGRPLRFAGPAVRYAELAGCEQAPATPDREAAALRYWHRRLADLPPPLSLAAPSLAAPRLAAPSGVDARAPGRRPVTADLRMKPDRAAGLRAFAAAVGATPAMLFATVLAGLLARYTGQRDLVLGTPVSTRDRPGGVGMFVNLLPGTGCAAPGRPARPGRARCG